LDAAFFVSNFVPGWSSLIPVESKADGSTEAQNVVGVKFGVIEDVVEVGLGADKESPPQHVADLGTGMNQEVIAVHAGGATREIAVAVLGVEKQALTARTGREVDAGLLGEAGRKHSGDAGHVNEVEVIEEGPVGLIGVVEIPLIAKGELGAIAEVVLVGALDADVGVESALLRRRQESQGSARVLVENRVLPPTATSNCWAWAKAEDRTSADTNNSSADFTSLGANPLSANFLNTAPLSLSLAQDSGMQPRADWWVRPGDAVAKWGEGENLAVGTDLLQIAYP
jgi:hypothetical protein